MQAGQQLAVLGGFGHGQSRAVAVDAFGPGQDGVDLAIDDDHAVVAGGNPYWRRQAMRFIRTSATTAVHDRAEPEGA